MTEASSSVTADGQPSIILTRAVRNNEALASRLAEVGFAAVSIPMIEVLPPADGGNALVAAVANFDLYHWLVVTSANGVRAVRGALEHTDSTDWPSHLKLAAVGPATAAAATEQGWPVDFVPTKATAKDLVQQFPQAETSAVGNHPKVLAALAELATPVVIKGLRKKGYQVDQIVAYRTELPTKAPSVDSDDPKVVEAAKALAAEELERISGADAIAFTSLSTVDRFVSKFGLERVPDIVVCIGPRTAKRAAEVGLNVTTVAASPAQDGMVEAIQSAFADR